MLGCREAISWGTEEKVVKREERATVAVALAVTRGMVRRLLETWQGGKGGKRRALDGSSAPEMLPKLPGPDEPTTSKAGKYKVVIHTAGMQFLQDAKVFAEEENMEA